MSAVTHSTKCYVFLCPGCGCLSGSERSDKLTCSTRCRVRAHRSGALARIREIAALPNVRATPAVIVQCEALRTLRPDLAERVKAGELTLDDIRRDIARAYYALVFAEVERAAT